MSRTKNFTKRFFMKTAAKVVFPGCKCAKIAKTDKSTQHPIFNLSFCYFRDSKSVSLFITNKKKREKTQKIPYFLQKYFAVSDKNSIFAVHLGNRDAYLTHRNPLYHNASFFDLFTCQRGNETLTICSRDSVYRQRKRKIGITLIPLSEI